MSQSNLTVGSLYAMFSMGSYAKIKFVYDIASSFIIQMLFDLPRMQQVWGTTYVNKMFFSFKKVITNF